MLAVGAALVVALVLVGRWEGHRHERAEIKGMQRVFDLVGPLDNSSLDAYRIDIDFTFDCLLYRRGADPYALELCFDRSGRLAEGVEPRGAYEQGFSSTEATIPRSNTCRAQPVCTSQADSKPT